MVRGHGNTFFSVWNSCPHLILFFNIALTSKHLWFWVQKNRKSLSVQWRWATAPHLDSPPKLSWDLALELLRHALISIVALMTMERRCLGAIRQHLRAYTMRRRSCMRRWRYNINLTSSFLRSVSEISLLPNLIFHLIFFVFLWYEFHNNFFLNHR